MQFVFIACRKSIIASFIDFFTQKTGPKDSRATAETAEKQEKLQGGESFLFSLPFLAIQRGGLKEPKNVRNFRQMVEMGQPGFNSSVTMRLIP